MRGFTFVVSIRRYIEESFRFALRADHAAMIDDKMMTIFFKKNLWSIT